MEERQPLRVWIGREPPPPDGLGGNDPSPNGPADEVNDSISKGASETAPPDFSGTFGAFERTREADERAINRALGQAAVYQFPAIEGYTPYDDPHADQVLVDRYLPRFLDVRSPDACRAMEYRLKREEREAELVCSSGWMGAVAAAGIGRPALATWIPGRVEYVAGELKYRPGHAALGYGFPDIDPVTFVVRDGGGRHGGGSSGDRRRSNKRTSNTDKYLPAIEVWADEAPKPPPPDASDGTGTPYDSPARHEINAPAVENVEAPRVVPPLADAETLSPQLQPVVEPVVAQPSAELPALKPADPEQANPEEPGQEPSGVAGLNPEPLTAGQQATEAPASRPATSRLGWVDQFKLSQTAAEYSSIEGAGRLYKLATVAKWLDENPETSDTDLLTEFAPGLLRIRWAERRQAMVDYLRGAPTLLEDVRQKQADYEAMESSGSFGNFTAWLAGQVTGGWKSPETYAGGSSKVASLLGRALWTGLKQAGIAAGSDAVAQWLLVKAGFQKEFNPVQTVTTAVTAGAVNAAGKAGADTVKLGISAKSGAPGGKVSSVDRPMGQVTEHAEKARTPDLSPVADPIDVKNLMPKERKADLARRNAGVTELAKQYPVSASYEKARVGEVGPSDYAKTFRRENPNVPDDVEVHHAVEQRIFQKYPGLFTKEQLNSPENLRGIPPEIKSSLHRSLIRKEWNAFYKIHHNSLPTVNEVLEHATMIDRKFGGLFIPPL